MQNKLSGDDVLKTFQKSFDAPAPIPFKLHYLKRERRLALYYSQTQVSLWLLENPYAVRKNGFYRVALPSELLRVFSPSAEIYQDDGSTYRVIGGKYRIEILDIDRVGQYAIRIYFSDRHHSGLFTWSWLFELARHQTQWWRFYLAALQKNQLKRRSSYIVTDSQPGQ